MHHELKVRAIGNSLGVILPKEILSQMKVEEGAALYLTQSPDGYRVTAHDPDFEEVMKAYRECASQYRNALRELAK